MGVVGVGVGVGVGVVYRTELNLAEWWDVGVVVCMGCRWAKGHRLPEQAAVGPQGSGGT